MGERQNEEHGGRGYILIHSSCTGKNYVYRNDVVKSSMHSWKESWVGGGGGGT
jgi:hypothetical protein